MQHLRYIQCLAIFLLLQSITNLAVELGEPCKEEEECGRNATCWYYPTTPGCELGLCICKAHHFKTTLSSTHCFARTNLTLDAPCKDNELEQYPPHARCYAGVVQCKSNYQKVLKPDEPRMAPFYGSDYDDRRAVPRYRYDYEGRRISPYRREERVYICVLQPSVQTEFGSVCTDDLQCNSDFGLFCDLGRQTCACWANYMWTGVTCQEAYYGMNCQTDDNCQTGGAFAVGGPGNGGACSRDTHKCVCDIGFQPVNFTQYIIDQSGDSLELMKYSWTICVVRDMNAINLEVGEKCSVSEWSSAVLPAGQSYCKSKKACVVCPEQRLRARRNETVLGTCVSGSSSLSVNFYGFAALLTALYLVAYVARLLTVIVGI